MSHNKVTIYHNPRCSKSRQTLELLEQNNVQPEIVEYMKDPLDQETLKNIIKLLGVPAKDILRSNEQVFKDAGMDDSDLSDEEIIDILSECPTILQRPIVVVDDKRAALGRPPESVLDIL